MVTHALGTRLTNEGAEIIGNTPEEAAAIIARDLDTWAEVIRAAKIPKQ